MRKVTWRRFNQSAKQLVLGQTTISSVVCVTWTHLRHELVGDGQQCRVCNMNAPETWTRRWRSPESQSWPVTQSVLPAGTVAVTTQHTLPWSARQSSDDRTEISSDTSCPNDHPAINTVSTSDGRFTRENYKIWFNDRNDLIWLAATKWLNCNWGRTGCKYKVVIWHWFIYCVGLIL